MAIIITPSRPLDEELDLKYATPNDTLQVISVDNGVVTVGFPSAQPYPPPYLCKSLINTRGITDLSNAWAGCTSITEFPKLDFKSCVNFSGAWAGCTSLVTFPAGVFDRSQCSNYANAWVNCSLNRQSVDNILTSLDRSGVTGGVVDITGGGNKGPSSTGKAARANLRAKGWVVNTECDRPPYNCNTDVDTSCVTDFSEAWFSCATLVSFPLIDVSKGVNFGYTWCYCLGLTSFPALDFSKGENFFQTWAACFNLTTFPEIDTSSGTYFGQTWADCRSLTSFPLLNINNGTYFGQTWQGCTSLTTFPAGMFDNSVATNFYLAWNNCALSQQSVDNILVSIDKAGQLNGFLNIDGGTSSTPSLVGWYAVASLQAKGWTVSVNGTPPSAWPPVNCNTNVQTYGVTDYSYAWESCYSLASFPLLNVSSGQDFSFAWYSCSALSSFPPLVFTSGTNFNFSWAYCWELGIVPSLTFSSSAILSSAWANCSGLATVSYIDFKNCVSFHGAWYACSSLVNFPAHAFDNCQATDFDFTWRGCSLSQQSVDNILISIDTAGRLNGTLNIDQGTSSPPGPAGLTAKASLVSRGWTVTTN